MEGDDCYSRTRSYQICTRQITQGLDVDLSKQDSRFVQFAGEYKVHEMGRIILAFCQWVKNVDDVPMHKLHTVCLTVL